jgi:hypothetical protein
MVLQSIPYEKIGRMTSVSFVSLLLLDVDEDDGQNSIGQEPVRLGLPCTYNVLSEDATLCLDVIDFNVLGIVPSNMLFCKYRYSKDMMLPNTTPGIVPSI